MDILFQVFGWVGAFGLLLAFFLNTRNILTITSKKYHWLNFICASLLTINAAHTDSYPFILINSFWAIVALVSIIKPAKNVNS